MTTVSYRLYCDSCDAETVVRKDEQEASSWKVNSAGANDGTCPECRIESVDTTPETPATPDWVEDDLDLTALDGIGDTAAQNLTDAGYDSVEAITEASDDALLDVSWVGEKTLEGIRDTIEEYK